MNRIFWGAALAGLFALLWWKIDWLLGLSEPWLSFAQVWMILLPCICAAGIILPERWATGFQALFAFAGLLFMASYIPAYL
ncbi:MAG: hypothetical protein LIO95_10050 [Clostridiales bacterium]|nr:hypothetical protein [Clostridiales bacterium]